MQCTTKSLGQKLRFKTFGVRLVQLVQIVQIVFSLRKKLQLSTKPLGQSRAKQEGCCCGGRAAHLSDRGIVSVMMTMMIIMVMTKVMIMGTVSMSGKQGPT